MKLLNVVDMNASFELLRRKFSSVKELRIKTAGLLFALQRGIEQLERRVNPTEVEVELLKEATQLEKRITEITSGQSDLE